MTYTRSRAPRQAKWPMPTGIVAIVLGLACWLFPLRIFRDFYKFGLYPTPERGEDGEETFKAIGEAFHFIRQIGNVGALLTIVGVALVAWVVVMKQKAQQNRDADNRNRRPVAARSDDPLDGADYVREDDGEERIVPRKKATRHEDNTNPRRRTHGSLLEAHTSNRNRPRARHDSKPRSSYSPWLAVVGIGFVALVAWLFLGGGGSLIGTYTRADLESLTGEVSRVRAEYDRARDDFPHFNGDFSLEEFEATGFHEQDRAVSRALIDAASDIKKIDRQLLRGEWRASRLRSVDKSARADLREARARVERMVTARRSLGK